MKTLWMFGLISAAACAQGVQNMDLSLMLGPASASGVVVHSSNGSTGMVSGTVGAALQIGFGYQVAATKAGSLFVELPFTWVFRLTGTVTGGSVAGLDRSTNYITPGIRLKIPTGSRISFYGVLGGGVAAYAERDSTVNGQLVASVSATTFHPALDFGGGIDLRISRWLSLRADERDFVSSAGLGGTAGHNHLQFLAGIAFHF
jgi:hypothetical protein